MCSPDSTRSGHGQRQGKSGGTHAPSQGERWVRVRLKASFKVKTWSEVKDEVNLKLGLDVGTVSE